MRGGLNAILKGGRGFVINTPGERGSEKFILRFLRVRLTPTPTPLACTAPPWSAYRRIFPNRAPVMHTITSAPVTGWGGQVVPSKSADDTRMEAFSSESLQRTLSPQFQFSK
ncbi:hypothetical protein NPIL_440321 [Nephila pilipes]|uniref:Uncharacterized protein n=1 Tax=Nephila pilipes TaxID=299642 RepID=A0A8X6NH56_NEPPI|nr:hypothetical protein NPIL_440321 [Nephila pilipes]